MKKNKLNISNGDIIKFMLSEFDSSWNMLESIDNRRGIYFNYYNAMFIAITGLFFGFMEQIKDNYFALIAFILVFIFIAILGCHFRLAIIHENKANNRYKNKINLIRKLFLSNSKSNKIKSYLRSGKSTGVKLPKNHDFDLNKIGPSLDCLIKIIIYEVIFSIILSLILLTMLFLKICIQ